VASLAVLTHADEPLPKRLLSSFERAGASWFEVPVHHLGPPQDGFDGLVVLGGAMGAYEIGLHPWLADEKMFLRRQVEEGVPVLGICLGSQLLAAALGGSAYLAKIPEAGVIRLDYTIQGKEHPVLGQAGERVFCLHQDTFELPPGAELLASSASYPLAFEIGSALALQFHPEVDAAQAIQWASTEEADHLRRAGVSLQRFIRELTEAEAELEAAAVRLFDAWMETLT
jgi:GMP synthase (glutamine-hydrolysing)